MRRRHHLVVVVVVESVDPFDDGFLERVESASESAGSTVKENCLGLPTKVMTTMVLPEVLPPL